jgi:uncharacterized protein YjbI with pentapeptide repeats
VIVLWVFALLFVMALGAVFLLVGGVLLGVALPDEKLPFTASLGIGAILVALLGAPFLIWRSVVAQRTLETTQDGLVTDRINAAVASLGADKVMKRQLRDAEGQLVYAKDEAGQPDLTRPAMEDVTVPNMEVRVGAILALGRIARENLSFHVQIMQILCAYVRENSPAASAVPFEPPKFLVNDMEDELTLEDVEAYKKELDEGLQKLLDSLPKRRTDIQTALDVLGRRNAEQKRKEGAWPDPDGSAPNIFDTPFPPSPSYPEVWSTEGHEKWRREFDRYSEKAGTLRQSFFNAKCYRLDLRNTNLQGYVMDGLDLRGAKIGGARMQGAQLEGAQMQGATLSGAQMQGAWLSGAQMQGAWLSGAEMQGAWLDEAEMQGAWLSGAEMQGAWLDEAEMQGAQLDEAEMQGARLFGVQMQGAQLDGAQMQGARLFGVRR